MDRNPYRKQELGFNFKLKYSIRMFKFEFKSYFFSFKFYDKVVEKGNLK